MITVSRLDGRAFVVNAELIEIVEANPDTVLTLTTGHKYVVRDSVEDIVDRVVAFRQRVYRGRPRLEVIQFPAAE